MTVSPDEDEVRQALGVLAAAAEVLDTAEAVQALVARCAGHFGLLPQPWIERCPDAPPPDWL